MSWTPTDEQARELGRVMEREMGCFLAHDPAYPDYFWTNQARAVLVAVGPMVAAQALRDAAGVQDEESARIREEYRQHNASRDPNRPPRRPDLNVWSNADEATAHRLRARADTIEKEAGR